MSNEIASLEAEVKEYQLQLETVLSGLQADPNNAELQNLKVELEEVISLTETAIAELKPSPAAPAPKPAKSSSPPVKEKWSRENHPAFQPGYKRPGASASAETSQASEEPVSTSSRSSFAVNEAVLAKWISGDNAFYPARITSITGSSHAPVYVVTFKNYQSTELLTAKDIKALGGSGNDSRKRKADGSSSLTSSGSSSPAPAASAGFAPPSANVISAAADIDPDLASQARREPSRVSDGPVRPAKIPRKVKANKELEAGKNKWQDFATKGKMGKGAKKDSMFRTPEGVNARVGFTGSGQAMRKDPTRSRHIYQASGEEE